MLCLYKELFTAIYQKLHADEGFICRGAVRKISSPTDEAFACEV